VVEAKEWLDGEEALTSGLTRGGAASLEARLEDVGIDHLFRS
jgi:hypothetical protein